jgi:crotonobetainyl-CoA:carnitine CoA-transferase CaiB-like acyl-CoA transferase
MPPLDGVRVIDLTRVLAGPYCTMLLGDMGAEVVKIEEPEHGDDTRGWAPFVDGWSTYFAGVNRSKKSLALDVGSPGGAEVLRRLVKESDILVENFRPGSLKRLGFGFDQVHQINPGLIYCSISGYGQNGPRSGLPGYDPVIQAESGLMDITGCPSGPPTRVGVAITDYLAGLYALQGILLALRHKDQSGEGQLVDIALFDSLVSTLAMPMGLLHATGESPTRLGNEHPSIAPYETLKASDGLVMVAVGNPRLWVQLCRALNVPQLAEDSRFRTNTSRLLNRPALKSELEQVLAQFSVDEAIRVLLAAGVPSGRVRTIAEAARDPQLEARGMLLEYPALPGLKVPGNPVKLLSTPADSTQGPPRLGEHNEEILLGLGYSAAEVRALTEMRITTSVP